MKRFDQVNMIPFIDVMLVLLTIVLTTASFVSHGLIEVRLPQVAQVSDVVYEDKPLEITINKENQLFFAGEQVDIGNVHRHLKLLPTTQLIVLRVDKAASFDSFMQLLDALKAQQLNNLFIQTERATS